MTNAPVPAPQPIYRHGGGLKIHGNRRAKLLKKCLISAVVLVLLFVGFGLFYFFTELSPLSADKQYKKITIDNGSSVIQVGQLLEEKKIIRSNWSFRLYVTIMNKSQDLKAGTYRLSASESVQDIVGRITDGDVDKFSITFLPGVTLVDSTDKPQDQKSDITTVLGRADYSDEEISDAFAKDYTGKIDCNLFDGRPLGGDLEGYIYGDTYYVDDGATVEQILTQVFNGFCKVLNENDLIQAFNERGFNLFEAITLASIIQREASNANDQAQVAQVFLKRLDIGMMLGSDVTYQYIADKTGIPRDPNLDSPYNTRRYTGLPPGPISNPSLTALRAVAYPSEGDYLYFLAGDDGKIHYSKTNEEHEQNIIDYCQIGCSTL